MMRLFNRCSNMSDESSYLEIIEGVKLMGYVVALLIASLGVLLGKVIVSFLQLENSKHAIVYGLFGYFSGFFILSGPFTFLHLHWHLYFFVMSLYHIALISLIIAAIYKKRIQVDISCNGFLQYVKDNYLVLALIGCFTFMSFASNNTLAGGATGDDIVYLSWAAKNINNTIYPPSINLLDAKPGNGDLLTLLSFLQLFWAYMQQAFNVDLVVFVRTSMAIVTYIWFFCTIDEVIFVFTNKRQYARFKYVILVALLLYYVNGMQSEVYKFMYNPWFGNVFSLMMHLPLLLLFFKQSLTNKKALYFVVLLPLMSAGFSPVSILHTGLTLFPLALLWAKYKVYPVRHERKILYISFVGSLVFLAVSAFPTARQFVHFILNPAARYDILLSTEMFFFRTAFAERLMFIVPGIAIFFYRLARKEVSVLEKQLALFGLAILLIAIVPRVDQLLFVAFAFPFRRVLDSYMLAFVFYSGAMLLLCVRRVKLPQLVGLVVFCSFLFHVGPGFYFQSSFFKNQFNLNNVLREKRFDPAITELAEFFESQASERTDVCTYEERELLGFDGVQRIDLVLAVAPVKNVYFNCELPANPHEHVYYISSDRERLYKHIGREHLVLVKRIETDQYALEVYEYIRT